MLVNPHNISLLSVSVAYTGGEHIFMPVLTKKAKTERMHKVIVGLLIALLVLVLFDIGISLSNKWYKKKLKSVDSHKRFLYASDDGKKSSRGGLAINDGSGLRDDAVRVARNATYFIDGMEYALRDGSYYGEGEDAVEQVEFVHVASLGDGALAVWLMHRTGGTGVFWHVAIITPESAGYGSGNAVFIGDRITPGKISLDGDFVVINYLDRAYGESFATSPSVLKKETVLRAAFDQ